MNNFKRKNSSPPYLLGLLCLIPLVGAFAGMGLLLYGIIKYKDKWIIIIGSFGIIFTIGFYSFFFYYLKNGTYSKIGFAHISQMQLNNLVKNIEFYKLQHGRYPDSLQQLLMDDKLAPIHDAIQVAQQRKNTYYNYKRVGNRYILFSSGLDGKPNTSDDLFPLMMVKDSSKIGLLSKP